VSEVEVRVSGWVFYECFDPMCTEFPREHPEVGEPVRVKVGKGSQFRYTVDRETAITMLEHARTFGDAMSFGVDDPSIGKRVVRWCEREAERLGLELYYEKGWALYR